MRKRAGRRVKEDGTQSDLCYPPASLMLCCCWFLSIGLGGGSGRYVSNIAFLLTHLYCVQCYINTRQLSTWGVGVR